MDLVRLMKALGAPMRLRIFSHLLERKHCVRSLSKKLGITESAVSQHLKVMREAGLIYGERYGYFTHYLPKQNGVDFLSDTFNEIRDLSLQLDRNSLDCKCDLRKEDNK